MTNWPNPCACLGPMNGEPYCNCHMVQCDLPRSAEHLRKQAEATEAIKRVFDELLEKK
jgi:hypothetical protein